MGAKYLRNNLVYIVNFSVFAISLCFGMGTTITGLVIRNRIIQVCGLIAGIGGFFSPLLHAELRLAVMSLLISAEEAEFPYIKEQTGATAGNLSVQIDKLSSAGYIEVEKTFKGKKPCTLCRITPVGLKAFEAYVESLKSYLKL